MRRRAVLLISFALLIAADPAPTLAHTPAQAPPKPVASPAQPPAQDTPAPAAQSPAPSAESLGAPPHHETMQFIESFDAGGQQRFYLFGSNAAFSDLVKYYQSQLKQRGERVFDQPATHMFDIGRFQEATMAFPPSITVKDFTWGGMKGYPNPKANAEPASFRTIVQIVPLPAAAPPVRK